MPSQQSRRDWKARSERCSQMPEKSSMSETGLADQAGRSAEGLCLSAQLCLRPSGRFRAPGPGCQRLRRSEMRAMQVLNHNAN